MKALVLAGGSGTRLRPITHTSAKQLVPIANKPVLFYVMEAIAAAGITDVGTIVGDSAAEIQEALSDGSKFGLDITYIRQDRPLGLAHAVLIARDYLGDDDFVMFLGDNFLISGIAGLVEAFRAERPSAQIMLTRVSNPSAFGIAELDAAGRVVRLEEKPASPKSDLALVGVYLFTPAVHEAVRNIKPSWRGELEITHAIQYLLDRGDDVRSTIIEGYWKDTGDVGDMLEANRAVLERIRERVDGVVDDRSEIIGRVVIEEGARVARSRIVGPVVIGAGTTIVDSYVGPYTSVDENCTVDGSELEFSIILRDASINGVRRVQASLIGRHVEVTLAAGAPNSHRLVLGDHSRIQLHS